MKLSNQNKGWIVLGSSALVLLGSLFVSDGDYNNHPKLEPFIQEMVTEHKYDEKTLRAILSQAERKDSILEAIARPAEKTKAWHEYRDIFITKSRIERGKAFMQEHKETLAAAEAKYGIPKEVITAIIGVETFYGRNKGSYRVIDALSTLAFDYPKRPIFWRELKNYLVLVRKENLDPLAIKGSYAGAMGYGQFIPSSFLSYAVDFDDDGVKDIWDNPKDAIGSVAYYFKRHGWRTGEPVVDRVTLHNHGADQYANQTLKLTASVQEWRERGVNVPKGVDDQQDAQLFRYELEEGMDYWLAYKNFYVITRYNHSRLYAMAVYTLSQALVQ